MDNTKYRAEKKSQEIKLEIEKINARIEKYTLELRVHNSEKVRLLQQLDLLNEIIGSDEIPFQEAETAKDSTKIIEGELLTDKIVTLLQQNGEMISADFVKIIGATTDNEKFAIHNAIKKLLKAKKIRQIDLLKPNGEKQKRNVPYIINY